MLVLACRTPSTRLPLEKLRDQDEEGDQTGEAREALEPLPVEGPSDLLPAEVPALAEALDPAAVLELFAPLDKFAEFNMVRSQARTELGVDPFDPKEWAKVGLDVHGPAGVGVLDVEAEGFFLYASLTDQAAFEKLIDRVVERAGMREELSTAEVGRGRVYRFGDELSVVLREGVAVLVFVDNPERVGRDYTATVATIDPREALSHQGAHQWAREQLVDGDDGMIFVNPKALLEQFDRADARDTNDYGVRYTREELDRARAEGASQDMIRELEARLEEERRWQREREAAEAGRRVVVDRLIGPIGSAMLAADLRGDTIVAHGRLLIPGEGLLRALFEPIVVESPLLTTLDEPPLMLVDGRLNMGALLELVELLARADGEELTALNAELRAELGVDVLGVLLPTLTGAGGFAITQHRPPDPSKLGEISKSFGVAAHAELTTPDAMRTLLDGLATNKGLGGVLARAKRGDGWVLSVPKWRDVAISVVGSRLVASTDTKLAARVADARAGKQAAALADPDHPLRGTVATPSLRMYQRFSALAMLGTHEPWEQDVESMLYDLNDHATLAPDVAAKVPRSRAFKKKLAELEKVIDELNAYQREQARRRFEQQLGYAEQFGDLGVQFEALSDGVGGRASWRLAQGATPLEILMGLFMIGGVDGDWETYDRLQTQSYELREELHRIRQADLDDAAAKRGAKG